MLVLHDVVVVLVLAFDLKVHSITKEFLIFLVPLDDVPVQFFLVAVEMMAEATVLHEGEDTQARFLWSTLTREDIRVFNIPGLLLPLVCFAVDLVNVPAMFASVDVELLRYEAKTHELETR